EIQVARGGHRAAAGLIFRRECGVVALDRRSGGRTHDSSLRQMQGQVSLYIQRRTEVYCRRDCEARSGFAWRVGQSQLRQQRRNAHRLLGPIDKLGLRDLVLDGKRFLRGVRIRCGHISDLAAKAVGKRQQLRHALPFFLRCLGEGQAKKKFVVASNRIVGLYLECALGSKSRVNADSLKSSEWKFSWNCSQQSIGAVGRRTTDRRFAEPQSLLAAKTREKKPVRSYLKAGVTPDSPRCEDPGKQGRSRQLRLKILWNSRESGVQLKIHRGS